MTMPLPWPGILVTQMLGSMRCGRGFAPRAGALPKAHLAPCWMLLSTDCNLRSPAPALQLCLEDAGKRERLEGNGRRTYIQGTPFPADTQLDTLLEVPEIKVTLQEREKGKAVW